VENTLLLICKRVVMKTSIGENVKFAGGDKTIYPGDKKDEYIAKIYLIIR